MTSGKPRAARRGLRMLDAASAALVGAGVLADLAGSAGLLPRGWPVAGYWLTAAGAGAALLAVLARVLLQRGDAPRARRATALELLAIGLLLGTWLLRGHPEIPPDPPLLGAAVLSLLLLLAARLWRQRRLARAG